MHSAAGLSSPMLSLYEVHLFTQSSVENGTEGLGLKHCFIRK